jgi:DNA-binding NtrC family response regulator
MKGARILLVDDEVDFTENMSRLLQNRGYVVTAVHSGQDAIEALDHKPYDIMVLDMKMPGMDGISTLREVKRRNLSTATLFLTGHGAVDTALEAMKLGAYDYLTKPCEIDELVEKIEGAGQKKNEKVQQDIRKKIDKAVDGRSF